MRQTDDAPVVRPTDERLKKGDIFQTQEGRGDKAKPWNAASALFDIYLIDGEIDRRQWQAADHFARIFFRAHGSPWRTQTWQGPINGSGSDLSDSRLTAQGALTVARSRLGQDIYSLLESVCGLHSYPSTWAKKNVRYKSRGEHPAAGLTLLRVGLSLYADHIGLADEVA